MNKKNHIASMVAIVIVIAAGSFYGGMKYDASKNASQVAARGQGGFGGGVGGAMRGQGGQGGSQRAGGMQGAGDFVAGEIIAKDETSVTIKGRDGGSKIVFFSSSTSIDKSVSGATSDLNVGQQVTINGKTSSDGSVTAQNIQIRPLPPVQSAQ